LRTKMRDHVLVMWDELYLTFKWEATKMVS
jgi:hypothetical protein